MATSMTKTIKVMDKTYRNPLFIQDLEDHIPLILNRGYFHDVGVDPAMALKFAGDFNGLMRELGHAPRMHYISMRLTGLIHNSDYKGDTNSIRVIDVNYLQLFANTWRTHRRAK